MHKNLKRIVSAVLSMAMVCSSITFAGVTSVAAAESVISDQGGWLESAYVEWSAITDSAKGAADGYAVYIKEASAADSAYTRLDNELIRKYTTYFRADAVGLKAGSYVMKIVPAFGGSLDESKAVVSGTLNVEAHDRSGAAFSSKSTLKTASGAYNDDGTLKSDALVFYVTKDTAKTITADLYGDSAKQKTTYTGMQDIIAAKEKDRDATPLDFRIIGTITDKDMDALLSNEGLQVKGKSYTPLNITIEGIGEDAAFNGFGMLLRQAANVEVRNLAIVNFIDDGVSIDTKNENLWIHNIDLTYGKAGGDSDQAKGDGSIDIKAGSRSITIAYNHFWDSGKCSLCGMNDSGNYDIHITYHHNWFDHSDSRMPRVRSFSTHVYNNYYDGISKYGVGSALGASLFVQNNYFNGCKSPAITGMQAHDVGSDGDSTLSGEQGGIIKMFGNKYVDCPQYTSYQQNNKDFDAYEATSADEKIPASIKAAAGVAYNNFDTDTSKFDLHVKKLDNAEDVPAVVKKYAGPMNGGTLLEVFGQPRSAFPSLNDASSYDLDTALKAAVTNYKLKDLVSIGGMESGGDVSSTESTEKTSETTTKKEGSSESTTLDPKTIVEDKTLIRDANAPEKVPTDDKFTFDAGSDSSSPQVYNHKTSDVIRLKSKGSISFTVKEGATIKIKAAGANADDAARTLTLSGPVSKTVTLPAAKTEGDRYPEQVYGENLPAGTYKLTASKDVDINEISITFGAAAETTSQPTTAAATSTTKAPEQSTKAPESSTKAPEPSTQASTEKASESTTADPYADVYGDVERDNDRDINDAATLLGQILDGAVDAIPGINDVNLDNKVDSEDVAIILQKILDSSYTMPCEGKVDLGGGETPTEGTTAAQATTQAGPTTQATTKAPEQPTEGTTAAQPTTQAGPTQATTEEQPTEGTTATPVDLGEAKPGFSSDDANDTGAGVSVTHDDAAKAWVLTDTSSTAAADLTIPFAEQTKGKVVITGTVEPSVIASKWIFVQVRGKKADGTSSEIVGFGGGETKGDLSVRKNGSAYTKTGTLEAKKYEYTIVIDLDAKTADVTIDGNTTTVTGLDVASVDSIFTTTSKSSSRNVTLSDPSVSVLAEGGSTPEEPTENTTAAQPSTQAGPTQATTSEQPSEATTTAVETPSETTTRSIFDVNDLNEAPIKVGADSNVVLLLDKDDYTKNAKGDIIDVTVEFNADVVGGTGGVLVLEYTDANGKLADCNELGLRLTNKDGTCGYTFNSADGPAANGKMIAGDNVVTYSINTKTGEAVCKLNDGAATTVTGLTIDNIVGVKFNKKSGRVITINAFSAYGKNEGTPEQPTEATTEKAPEATTKAPEATTKAPEATTKAPEATTEGTSEATTAAAFRFDYAPEYVEGQTMAEGAEIFSKNGVKVSAGQVLNYEQRSQEDKDKDGLGDATFDGVVQENRLKSTGVGTSLTLDGTKKTYRVMAKIEATAAAKVSLAVSIPAGKDLLFATIDGSTAKTVKKIDTITAGFEIVTVELNAGDTVYLIGQSTNPEIYGIDIDAIEGGSTPEQSTEGTSSEPATSTPSGEGAHSHVFTGKNLTSDFFTFTSCNTKTNQGSVEYNGQTISECLQIETHTDVSFTGAGTLKLVFKPGDGGKRILIDGEEKTIGTDNTLSVELGTGEHHITKRDTVYVFYMEFTE